MNGFTLFPSNPTDKMIYQPKLGVLYQFDAGINAWVDISSSSASLPMATSTKSGIMSSADLRKLNRLMIPFPVSTITGNNCVNSFNQGAINLSGDDKFVNVSGFVDLKNINQYGEMISESFPFQIHHNTYGFNFTLDMSALVAELKSRGQFNPQGKTGDAGLKGDTGDQGANNIMAGPAGEKGDKGDAPPFVLQAEPEPLQAQIRPGLNRALTGVKTVLIDKDMYKLKFERRVVGLEDVAATQFIVQQQQSSWILAVESISGDPQPVFYLDVEPLLQTIRDKYLDEIDLLKKGYEDIVRFWVQTMSDLFDEQKAALCCALEFCMSKTKSTQLRQHMESVAASALPDANIKINNRESNEVVLISGTGLSSTLPDNENLCASNDNIAIFPESAEELVQSVAVVKSEANNALLDFQNLVINPLLNSGQLNGLNIELDKGHYTIIIKDVSTNIDNKYACPVVIRYSNNNRFKYARFLNKGEFDDLNDAKNAYNGLTTAFDHDGGAVSIYFNILNVNGVDGNVVLQLLKKEDVEPVRDISGNVSCRMPMNKIKWYEKGWKMNKGCGFVIEVAGQDYIVVKRSVGDDDSCGGGESESSPCISKFITLYDHPAIAWPTFDGYNFAPIPSDGAVFRYDKNFNDIISNSDVNNLRGVRPSVIISPVA